jgi:DNA-binding transcriptional LysR family regulator
VSSYKQGVLSRQRVLESSLLKAGFDLGRWKPKLVLGTSQAVVSAVEAGLGIAFVSSLAIKKSLALGLAKVVNVAGLRLRRDFPQHHGVFWPAFMAFNKYE